MPIHDWTRIDVGLFHAFHQGWVAALSGVLNTGGLPPDYFALIEPSVRDPTLDLPNEAETYARKADRITVRHRHGRVAAVIEIVSPGNKAHCNELRAFVEKAADLIRQDIHLLVIGLFPPTPRDPQGIHKAIWDDFIEEELPSTPDKPLTLVSYDAGPPRVAYLEPVAVRDRLPDMPLFLKPEFHVPAPLEATYQATWAVFPAPLKRLLEGPSPQQANYSVLRPSTIFMGSPLPIRGKPA
jgi:hypothetical protein